MSDGDRTVKIVAITAISLTVLAIGLVYLFLRQGESSGPIRITPTSDGSFLISESSTLTGQVRRF